MNSYQNLLTEQQNHIRRITINREPKLNALNKETIAELQDAFTEALNDPATGGIILTGAGTKAFVAGADISEFSALSGIEAEQLAKNGHTAFDMIHNSSKPVIAAVNGFALGGGLELAMACHIRVASLSAKMGLPEVTLGLIPGYGGTQRLTQLVGRGRALELIMSADMINAETAEKWGLVNYAVPAEELMDRCSELMEKILSRSPNAIAHAIAAVNAGLTDGVNGYETEIEEFGKCFNTPDFREGVSAFMEKRKPSFR